MNNVICKNCGAENNNEAKFCVKCGQVLEKSEPVITIGMDSTVNPNPTVNNIVNPTPIVNNMGNMETTTVVNNATVTLNYFKYLAFSLFKPITNYQKNESSLNNTKNAFILTLIVSVVMTIINLIQVIFNTVYVKSFSLFGESKATWEWENLKNVKFFEVIGKNFIIYIGVILVIALIFYFASLVVKKELSYVKSLSITTTSVVPAVLGTMVLSPLLSKIFMPLGIIFTLVGVIYTIVILYELINSNLNLNGDKKVYVNLICFALIIAVLFVIAYFMISSATTDALGDLSDLSSMFK